jgi:arylsulfatase A-like enzyme
LTEKRPNFLIFITDQHRADHLSCMGNTELATPNIDAISESGRRFDKMYVATPICMPNRATLFTGRMPSLHGAHCNGAPLSLRANTFTDLLRQSGYRTRLVGKAHLQNMTGRPATMQRDDNSGARIPDKSHRDEWLGLWDGNYEQENTKRWAENPAYDVELPYYGFEKVDLCTMHGDVVGAKWRRWANEIDPDIEGKIGPENALPDDRYTTPQAYRTRVPEALYPTAYITDHTMKVLDELGANHDEPFFLVSSYPDPHHPFTPPGRYWDMHDPDDIGPPATIDEFEEPRSPVLEHLRAERANGSANTLGTLPYLVNEREAREAKALTYGMIRMIDDGIGRVMSHLKQLGFHEDTVVIFMSDHGDYMGDHGLMLKAALHYQGLIRVPFIWSEPRLPEKGTATKALHSTLDIARTILARAGVHPFWGMQGRDMGPVLWNPKAQGNPSVLIEEDGHDIAMGFERPVRVRTLVTDSHRMSIYDGLQWGELYDLYIDPHEMNNLFTDPAHAVLRARLFEQMARQMTALADRGPFPTGRA